MHGSRPSTRRSIPLVGLALLALTAGQAVRAEFAARILPEESSVYDVAPSADGYAVVYRTTAGGEAFRTLGPTGRPTGDAATFPGLSSPSQLGLAPASEDGWVVVGRNFFGPVAIWSIRLDGAGGAVAGPETLVETTGYFILGSFGLATDRGNHLVVWSEDILAGDAIYAIPLGDDGKPSGDRSTLMPVPQQIGAPLSPSVVATSGGFFAAWSEIGQVIRARETKRSGAPVGRVEDVQFTEADAVRPGRGFPTTVGNREVVVYDMANPAFSEIRGRLRTGTDRYADPVVLVGGTHGEGNAALRGASSRGSTIAVLYTTDTPGGWSVAEFDGSLQRIGPSRVLHEQYGVDFVRASIDWDGARGRWMIHGPAEGPEGRGIYLLGIDPAN